MNEDRSVTQTMSGSVGIINQDGTGTADFRVIATSDPAHSQHGQAALMAAAHAVPRELFVDTFTSTDSDEEQQSAELELDLVYQAQTAKTAVLQKPPAVPVKLSGGKLPGLYAMKMEPTEEVRSAVNVEA